MSACREKLKGGEKREGKGENSGDPSLSLSKHRKKKGSFAIISRKREKGTASLRSRRNARKRRSKKKSRFCSSCVGGKRADPGENLLHGCQKEKTMSIVQLSRQFKRSEARFSHRVCGGRKVDSACLGRERKKGTPASRPSLSNYKKKKKKKRSKSKKKKETAPTEEEKPQ